MPGPQLGELRAVGSERRVGRLDADGEAADPPVRQPRACRSRRRRPPRCWLPGAQHEPLRQRGRGARVEVEPQPRPAWSGAAASAGSGAGRRWRPRWSRGRRRPARRGPGPGRPRAGAARDPHAGVAEERRPDLVGTAERGRRRDAVARGVRHGELPGQDVAVLPRLAQQRVAGEGGPHLHAREAVGVARQRDHVDGRVVERRRQAQVALGVQVVDVHLAERRPSRSAAGRRTPG